MSELHSKRVDVKEALVGLWLGPGPAIAAFLALFISIERTIGAHQSDVYESLVAWRAWTGKGPWPLAETGWNGPWNIWASIPFVAFFGPVRSAIFSRNAFFGCLAVFATYGLGRRIYGGRGPALLGSILLACCPGFVSYAAAGIAANTAALSWSLLACWALVAWAQDGGYAALAWGALSLGLSVGSHSTMLPALAVLGTAGWLARRRLAPYLRALPRWKLACAAALFALPPAPFLVYVARHVHGLPAVWLWRIGGRSGSLHYGASVLVVLGYLKGFFAGSSGDYCVAAAGASVWPAAAALVLALGMLARRRLAPEASLLPWALLIVHVLLAALSPTKLYSHHMLPAAPYAALVAAGAAGWPGPRRAVSFWTLAVLGVWQACAAAGWESRVLRRSREIGTAPLCSPEIERWAGSLPRSEHLIVFGDPADFLEYYSSAALSFERRDDPLALFSPAARHELEGTVSGSATTVVYPDIGVREGMGALPVWLRARAARGDLAIRECPGVKAPDGSRIISCLQVSPAHAKARKRELVIMPASR